MATSPLIGSLTKIRSRVLDRSLRTALDNVIRQTLPSAKVLEKKSVMTLFYAATDHMRITSKEIAQLDAIYKEIAMSDSANRYMQDVLRQLKAGGASWKIDHSLDIKREKILHAKSRSGRTIAFGIRGTLTLNGVKKFHTLERPATGGKRCIAPGRYTLRLRSKYSSVETDGIAPTGKSYTRIQVPDNQSERGGIQIHWGKDISWSDGCTLVGAYDGDRWVPDKSETIYKSLVTAIGGNKAYKPTSKDEWSLVPRVRLTCSFRGLPT